MQFAPHAAAQGGVDDLVLPDAGEAAELLGHDGRSIVVAIAGQILDGHACIRQRLPDQRLDLTSHHRHTVSPSLLPRQPATRAAYVPIQEGKNRSCAARNAVTDMVPPSGSVKSCPPLVPMRTAATPAASAARSSAAPSGTAST